LSSISRVEQLRRQRARLEAAREERRARRAAPREGDIASLTALQVVPIAHPGCDEPFWLAPYADVLDEAVGGGLEVVVSAPPQHGKTTITTSALALHLARRPNLRFAYATYNSDRALSVARDFKRVAFNLGLDLSGPVEAPRTSEGGGVVFVGRGSSLTGEPITGFGVVDDPFKDDVEAKSKAIRDRVDEWHSKVWHTRLHPGTSQVVMATRWAHDDLSGRLIRMGWRYVNLRAIAGHNDPLGREFGEALSPHWPLATLLAKKRRNPRGFSAMYQGEPIEDGETVFGPPRFFEAIPIGARVGIGVDLAFTASTSSDWSVICVMLAVDELDEDGEVTATYFIIDMVRVREKAPDFNRRLEAVKKRYPGINPLWLRGGFEHGVADFIPVEAEVVNRDKLVRATPVATDWNAGRVLIPQSAEWADSNFIDRVQKFTGVGDEVDDEIDAMAAAHRSLLKRRSTGYYSEREDSEFTR
jgi:predicted phage terminase large subunit-like protein